MTMTAPNQRDAVDFAHTGPGTLAGRYFRRFWIPVARLEDVAPGRTKPIQLLNEKFTLYRGETGTPHLVGYYCAHRSTQMSTGWVEGDCIRCFYHGWKYDEHGNCIEQPAEADNFAAKIRIGRFVRRQAKAQIAKRGGSPDAREFSRIESVAGLTVVECGRPALFSSAPRAFGFELRCAELPIAGRGNEAERSRVRIHGAWPVFERHSSSACNARFTFRSAVSSS